MLALPGLLLLLTFIYVRPQEFLAPLRSVPLLYAALGLALFGMVLDVRRRFSRAEWTPMLGWTLALWGWCLLGLLVQDRAALGACALNLGVDVALYLCIAHGVQTFRAFRAVAAALLGLMLFVSLVAIEQGGAPLGCHRLVEQKDELAMVYDGRPCQTARDCRADASEPGAEHLCEHVGLLDTSSIGGRVRYRGKLNDPNELALAAGVALPFAFALFQRRRSAGRWVLLLVAIGVIGECIVLSRSRGGQLVLLVVLGFHAVRRFGGKGIVVGMIAALPVLLLGGRSSEEADSSSLQRIECWYEGLQMARTSPLLGVGQGHFVEHHYLTAHNSFVLAAAELGLPGLILFSALVYLAIKIPVQALRRLAGEAGALAGEARVWAAAQLCSALALLPGIFFLSFCYHPVLWVALGMSAALSSAMRTHDARWRVGFGWRDLALVVSLDALVLAALFAYTRFAYRA